MSTRSPSRSKLRSKPKEGFLERLLDPIDRLSETIYSILILLTFTFAFRIFRLGPNPDQVPSADYVNDLLIGALGATLAWGLIDGVIYAMRSVFERGEKHRLLKRIQSAATDDEKTEAIAEELDHILEPIAGADKRQELYVDVLDHLRDSQPQPVQLTRDDLAGALGSVLVAVIAVTPSLVPLVLFRDNYSLAIRFSNIISFIVLFYTGYRWGQYSGSSPWKTGLFLAVTGAAMMLIALPLGG
jgi:VIT1/CCC1 family predicted Fe2+/Mn2+ transporter